MVVWTINEYVRFLSGNFHPAQRNGSQMRAIFFIPNLLSAMPNAIVLYSRAIMIAWGVDMLLDKFPSWIIFL
jgi:hypothetical protein